MKIRIEGREYDGTVQPFIGDLRLLQKQFGFGYGTVMKRLQGMNKKAVEDILDDGDLIEALIAWIWMTRLRAGERDLTVEQVQMMPLDTFEMIRDGQGDAAEAVEPPTPRRAPTGTGRGAAAGRRRKAP